MVAGDTPAEIQQAYVRATGLPPMMPEYGLGFWQSKARYWNQEQVLEVARGYKERSIPLDVLVIDFFHWPRMGDFRFDAEFFPDPEKMVQELRSMGIEPMVSVWTPVDYRSENFEEMMDQNLLVHVEPGYTKYDYGNYRHYLGPSLEVGNIYPQMYTRLFYEGLMNAGHSDIVNLVRCAWAGSQRYGALVWSGDVASTWTAFRRQICAGINMGMAGIAWWTTDIGGFHSGDVRDPKFRELLVRWFEWGTFCPVMRLHGARNPHIDHVNSRGEAILNEGAPNEVWSYGPELEDIFVRYIRLREKMRPYVRELMRQAHEEGTPVIRPMFYEFPDESVCWELKDQYMFGGDVLAAPIVYEDTYERQVYLPKGASWTLLYDGTVYQGGRTVTVPAQIAQIPVCLRDGS